MAANDVTAVSLPVDVRAGVKDTSSQRIEPLAVHVVADDPVTVYGLNRQKYTTDAFLSAVPVTATGTRYRVVDYEFGMAPAGVGVVATEGRTTVTIDPPSPRLLETHTVRLLQPGRGLRVGDEHRTEHDRCPHHARFARSGERRQPLRQHPQRLRLLRPHRRAAHPDRHVGAHVRQHAAGRAYA